MTGEDAQNGESTILAALPAVPIVLLHSASGEFSLLHVGKQLDRLCGCNCRDVFADPALLLQCVHPDDFDRLHALALRAWRRNEPIDTEFRLQPREHPVDEATVSLPEDSWVRIRAVPETQANGDVRWAGLLTQELSVSSLRAELRRHEQSLFNIARNIPGAVFRYGINGDGSDFVEYVSQGCLALWEIPATEVLRDAAPLWAMVHPDDLTKFVESVQKSAKTLQPWCFQWRITTPSGVQKWLHGAGQPQRQPDGGTLWDSVIVDVTAKVEAESERRRSDKLYRILAENTTDLVMVLDGNGGCEYASPSAEQLLGVAPSALMGTSLFDRIFPEDVYLLGRALSDAGGAPIVFRELTGKLHLEGKVLPLPGADQRLLLSARDVTRRLRMEARLRHDATHDLLTGLANRTLLEQRLNLALQRQQRHPDRAFGVLFLDIDRFKLVNDSLGHHAGDELLVHVSRQLLAVTRPTDVAARLSGDEFVVVLEDVTGIDEVHQVAQRIDGCLRQPVYIHGRLIHPEASMGIVLSGAGYKSASQLMRDADVAMYRCKGDPNTRYTIFDPRMQESVIERLQLESDLRRAVHERRLTVYFQPIVELSSGRTVAAEALVRWYRCDGTVVPPNVFIPLAEESGLIVDLDDWVLEEALGQMARWRRLHGDDAPRYVSVNLSAVDLRHPLLVEKVRGALATVGVPPTVLQLEVTESMLISNFKLVEGTIRQLVQMGVRISLDDFGTGYSSLAYLHRLSVQCIKADRSFVDGAQRKKAAKGILKSLSVLAESLSTQLIAEGVETAEQVAMLQELGYFLAQGFLFARPMSADDFAKYLDGPGNSGNTTTFAG